MILELPFRGQRASAYLRTKQVIGGRDGSRGQHYYQGNSNSPARNLPRHRGKESPQEDYRDDNDPGA